MTTNAPAAVPPPATPASAATANPGFLPIRYEAATGKVFLTVPRLGEQLLYLNTLATGLGSAAVSLDRGEVGINAVVHFERRGARLLLIHQNTVKRAVTGNAALRRSVEESFPNSVLASMPVQSEGAAGIVVDATAFFLSDVFDVVGRLRAAQLGTVRIDLERSFVDPENSGVFPTNTEVRSVLSYVTDAPPPAIRLLAPDGRSITLAQHHSFVKLPVPELAIREFDPRAGLFASSFFDFAQGFSSDYRRRGVSRWRLEPCDPDAYARGELVEPVKPIVYYLDPAIPDPYRTAFVEGGMWWNRIFEAAGWRNAFRVEPLPAGVDPLDARYPMIYWVHRQQRGPSVGPRFVDPRTGEIITTVVRMDSYRSLVDHDIYMGLVPAAGASGLELTAEQFAMARRRQHAAHEIGHTLGLAHNFVAASQNRASVMDYPYPLIQVDASGKLSIADAYRPSGGAHDTLAIRYAYTWYRTPAEEAAGLKRIVREGEARGLRFVNDQHAAAAGSYPSATQWVEGRDMLHETGRSVAASGAGMLRGGAFKPRSSPYAFQGLGEAGLRMLAEVRAETGLPIVTEVMDTRQVELVAEYADVLQIGARNMQNFSLLSEVGRVQRPVLLKRGLSATIKEFLMAAEYVMAQGNRDVILCERGIRTYETATRNTLDGSEE
ncbi:MAG: DUF5117 domain-containing protein, partial [Gemmatimonadetes bacterium]|nr:DUF5117 domain-containing protein [Gemmatimonadota bacterium]